MIPFFPARGLALAAALVLGACAAPPAGPALAAPVATPATRLIVFGEQHDQLDQQRQVADAVRAIAAQGRLRAVVIEMAERGRSTAGLPADADEARVRDALAWNDKGWPWAQYGPVVMNAVRAGVPVFGGNLPNAGMRAAMADASLDAQVDDGVRGLLTDAVREGHCGLMPDAQLPGMVRIQVARDLSMTRTIVEDASAANPDPARAQLLLLTGAQHASRDRGVTWHLARQTGWSAADIHVIVFGGGPGDAGALRVDEVRPAAATPRPDPCVELKKRLPAAPERGSSR